MFVMASMRLSYTIKTLQSFSVRGEFNLLSREQPHLVCATPSPTLSVVQRNHPYPWAYVV